MKIIKFTDYQEYKDVQIKGYTAKVETHSWVDTYSIRALTSYINDYNPNVKFGLCHGTRRGIEQNHFINTFTHLGKNVEVIGTEIAADAANRFPNTIEWDFHEVKDDWIKNVDFIYSNSFDHSYKPKECLDTWMSCLNEKGLCILEWNEDAENNPRPVDPFAASFGEYKEMIEEKYEIVDILESDIEKDERLINTNFKTYDVNSGKKISQESKFYSISHPKIDWEEASQRYFFIIKNKD